MGFFKSLINEMKDNLSNQIKEVADNISSVDNSPFLKKGNYESKDSGFKELPNEVYGVSDLRVINNGYRYAIIKKEYGKTKGQTPFEYDEVMAMSPSHIRVGKISSKGVMIYAVASSKDDGIVTPCDYISVKFFDQDNLLLTDSDGDEFIINSYGELESKREYVRNLKEDVRDNKDFSYDDDNDEEEDDEEEDDEDEEDEDEDDD